MKCTLWNCYHNRSPWLFLIVLRKDLLLYLWIYSVQNFKRLLFCNNICYPCLFTAQNPRGRKQFQALITMLPQSLMVYLSGCPPPLGSRAMSTQSPRTSFVEIICTLELCVVKYLNLISWNKIFLNRCGSLSFILDSVVSCQLFIPLTVILFLHDGKGTKNGPDEDDNSLVQPRSQGKSPGNEVAFDIRGQVVAKWSIPS